MEDIIIDTSGLHIRHIEPVMELPYYCPHCKKEVEPSFMPCMVNLVLGGILLKGIPQLPPQGNKIRIIIQDEGKIA